MDKTHPISVVHIASGDLWAGAEVQLFTLAKALNNQPDITINVVLLNHGTLEKKLLNNGINVTVHDESKLSFIQILLQLIKLIRNIQPDVIHTHRVKENILGSIAARYNHIPALRTVHGAPEHALAWHQLSKRLIHSMDWFCGQFLQEKIISVSDELAKILGKRFSANKIQVIENGIDTENFPAHRLHDSSTSRNSGVIKVGFIGRLVLVKRVDIFIKTAHFIQEHYHDMSIEFYIYGDGPLRDKLESLSHELNTVNIVHFKGHVDNIIEKIQKLDLLLMTSDHEGLPMVLLEAMAIKTPIASHSVGGIPKLLDYGRSGILINEHTPSDYAKAIVNFVNSPDTIDEITNNAFDRVKNIYSARNNAAAYNILYHSLANTRL